MTEGVIFLWFIMTGETILLLHRIRKMSKRRFTTGVSQRAHPIKFQVSRKKWLEMLPAKEKKNQHFEQWT